ncbi:MAG: ABC transporter ATP-binding protein/permease, partial [Halobacteriovoraceae bacterium]|nr:ABC transporter ATP-binding protein/permease [Halobacteriovoraceae bacterium]
FASVIAFRFFLDLLQGHFGNILFLRIKKNLVNKLNSSLPVLKTRFSNVEVIERISMDIPNLVENLVVCSLELLTSLLTLLFVCATIVFLNPSHLYIGLMAGGGFFLTIFIIKNFSHRIHLDLEISEEQIFRQEKNFVEGYEYLKTSQRLRKIQKGYGDTLTSHFKNETKKMLFDTSTSGFLWACRFGFILLLVTPAFETAGVTSVIAFWIFLLINIFQQISFGILRIYSVKPVWDRCSPLFSAVRGMERREFLEELELEAKNLEIYFDSNYKVKGISNLSFCWKKDERIWIKGPSGFGKTTLLRTILGMNDYYKGKIKVPDQNQFRLGYVQQDPFFFDGESIGYNLGIEFQSKTKTKEEINEFLVDTLELKSFFESIDYDLSIKLGQEGIWPSRGQRIRLALFRELIQNPDILFVDEPTSGLDERLSQTVLVLLSEISKNKIIVISEHSTLVNNFFKPTQILEIGSVSKTININTTDSDSKKS